jgi:hypothetical protein
MPIYRARPGSAEQYFLSLAVIESSSSIPKRLTPMLDKLEKTYELMAILEAAVPFEVALLLDLIDNLARQGKPVVVKPIETVSGLSYL